MVARAADDAEAGRRDVEAGRQRILSGRFPDHINDEFFRGMLDYFGESPYIVRSSSILEDARGNAFSGKYESVFVSNRGTREDRMEALPVAVRRVYASVLDEEALQYRRRRGLMDSEGRMALLIMRVSGAPQGRYYYPQAAGVGLSYNPFVWHPDIDPTAGVLRLVFGLGTRAVDRSDDDYTRLVALNAPTRRPGKRELRGSAGTFAAADGLPRPAGQPVRLAAVAGCPRGIAGFSGRLLSHPRRHGGSSVRDLRPPADRNAGRGRPAPDAQAAGGRV